MAKKVVPSTSNNNPIEVRPRFPTRSDLVRINRAIIGAVKKNKPVSLVPRERPTTIDKSIKYLAFSIKLFVIDEFIEPETSLREKYRVARKKKVSKDSVVPK